MTSRSKHPSTLRVSENSLEPNAADSRRYSTGLSAALWTLLISTVVLSAGCDRPESECSSDSDCPRGQTCDSIAHWKGDQPVSVFGSDLVAPPSSTDLPAEDVMTITVSRTEIRVDDHTVTDIEDGKVDASVKRGGESGLEIIPLLESLNTVVEQKKQEMKLLGKKFKPMVMIIADQSTPQRLFTEVMYTAGQAGLSKFKLAVRRSSSPWQATEGEQ